MGIQRATGIFALWGDKWFSPLASDISQTISVTNSPTTNMASAGRMERLPGLASQAVTITGFVDEDVTKGAFSTNTEDHWLTVGYKVPVQGDYFYSFLAIVTNVSVIGGPTGGAQLMSVSFENKDRFFIRGRVMQWSTTTATGNTAGYNFGAMAAADTLYHIYGVDTAAIAGTSPTMDVDLERSASDSWGAPTTVYSLAQTTDAPANTYITSNSVTGTQAETWYRESYTIGGSGSPSFRWFAGIGTTTVT